VEDLHKSVAHFESALARDPDYALAYTGLADTYTQFAFEGMLPAQESFAHAKKFAEAALRIDDRMAEAHTSIAGVKRYRDWDWTGADASFRKALEIEWRRSSRAPAICRLSFRDGALRGSSEGNRRGPRAGSAFMPINMEMAWILYVSRDFKEQPNSPGRLWPWNHGLRRRKTRLDSRISRMGMIEESIVEPDNARACSGDHPAALAALAHALGRRGENEPKPGFGWINSNKMSCNVPGIGSHCEMRDLGRHDEAIESLHEHTECREALACLA